jgi:riboflavin synthase
LLAVKTEPRKLFFQTMVFTGIVEEQGEVLSMSKVPDLAMWDGSIGEGWVLVVKPLQGLAVQGAYIGCSIAVNGVCLTATAFDDTQFSVGISPETLRLTNLTILKKGDRVG